MTKQLLRIDASMHKLALTAVNLVIALLINSIRNSHMNWQSGI